MHTFRIAAVTILLLVIGVSITFAQPCTCGCGGTLPNCGCNGPCPISGESTSSSSDNGQAETAQANWEAGANTFINSGPQGGLSTLGTSGWTSEPGWTSGPSTKSQHSTVVLGQDSTIPNDPNAILRGIASQQNRLEQVSTQLNIMAAQEQDSEKRRILNALAATTVDALNQMNQLFNSYMRYLRGGY